MLCSVDNKSFPFMALNDYHFLQIYPTHMSFFIFVYDQKKNLKNLISNITKTKYALHVSRCQSLNLHKVEIILSFYNTYVLLLCSIYCIFLTLTAGITFEKRIVGKVIINKSDNNLIYFLIDYPC